MLRVVLAPVLVLLLVVPVLLDTDPDAGLLDVVPLPTAARDDAVRLVPNEALDVVAVLLPETEVPDGALPILAVTLSATVSWREPL